MRLRTLIDAHGVCCVKLGEYDASPAWVRFGSLQSDRLWRQYDMLSAAIDKRIAELEAQLKQAQGERDYMRSGICMGDEQLETLRKYHHETVNTYSAKLATMTTERNTANKLIEAMLAQVEAEREDAYMNPEFESIMPVIRMLDAIRDTGKVQP